MAESVQNLKKRIKSIGNINKITKAMELVAATKMRRSQEIALASRPYAFAALDLLANLSLLNKKELPLLMEKRKVKKTLFVLVASDKGLAGAFNSSIFKKFEKIGGRRTSPQSEDLFVAVGGKSFNYLSKKRLKVVKKFTNVGDFTTAEQVQPLTDFLVEGYLKKDWDKVIVFSTHFKSALKQESLSREVLPVSFTSIKETVKEIIPDKGKFAEIIREQGISFINEAVSAKGYGGPRQEYLIEPSAKGVLDNLVKHLFSMQMYHLILEANASEHAARRLAMKTASDNASDLGQALNLQYNKVRQGAITSQIIEIIAGAESLQ